MIVIPVDDRFGIGKLIMMVIEAGNHRARKQARQTANKSEFDYPGPMRLGPPPRE